MSSLQTDAGTVLVLAPDWRRPLDWVPALAAYIVAAPVDGDTCLALDSRAVGLTGAAVAGLVERACEYLSEGNDFAEVLLAPGAARERRADVVESAAELVDRLGLSIPQLERTWRTLVGHAVWAKALVDDLQGQIDKALYESAPPVDLDGEPLVTVRIATFGSTDLLVQRAIPSVLGGQYENIELLICSDGPQPHAREAVAQFDDPRIRYIEVPARPHYPKLPFSFWRVAGAVPMNLLLEEARGDLIAALDHDDAFTVDHIPVLLAALRRERADFAYGIAMTEEANGSWGQVGHPKLQEGGIVHASVMYTRRLMHMRYDTESWLWDDPADWNMWRRIQATGARIVHVPYPITVHFKERTSVAGRDVPDSEVTALGIDDLQHSGNAGALLSIASRAGGANGLGNGGTAPRPRPAAGRPAIVAREFPSPGIAPGKAAALLERHPDLVFFSKVRTHTPWPRPVYGLNELAHVAKPLGIREVYLRDDDLAGEVGAALKGSRIQLHRKRAAAEKLAAMGFPG